MTARQVFLIAFLGSSWVGVIAVSVYGTMTKYHGRLAPWLFDVTFGTFLGFGYYYLYQWLTT